MSCAVVGLNKSLIMNGNKWLSTKADMPFGAVIEQTNYTPFYYRKHIIYIISYL